MFKNGSDMQYWKVLFARAFSDTSSRLIEWKGVGVALILFLVIFILTRLVLGKETARENVMAALVSLVGTILVFGLIFTVHFCFVTPKKCSQRRRKKCAICKFRQGLI